MTEYFTEILYRGRELKIMVTKKKRTSGSKVDCPVVEFIEEQQSNDEKKLIKRIEKIADLHPIMNKQQFRKIQGKGFDKLWEIKYDQLRIFGYLLEDESKLILLEGSKKKSSSLPSRVYQRINDKYLEVL